MAHEYGVGRGDIVKGGLFALWILGCDAMLKMIARVGGCSDGAGIGGALAQTIYSPPPGGGVCPGTEMAGPSITLLAQTREAAFLGLGEGMTGLPGQLYALALLFVATAATILVVRWQWRASGDPRALGALWAAAILESVPRFTSDGAGLSELLLFGASTGVADLALAFGVLWLSARVIGEFRA